MHLYLAGNNKLLTDTRLNDQDCEALYKLLRNNVFIDSLDLRYNNITDAGAKWIAMMIEVSPVARKPALGFSNPVQHKPGCTATEEG